MTGTWFRETPESLRALAEERVLVAAAELVSEGLESRGVKRRELADLLGVGRSEISQRLSGGRNLTVRSLAAMLHELDYDLDLHVRDRRAALPVWSKRAMTSSAARYTTSGTPLRLVSGDAA